MMTSKAQQPEVRELASTNHPSLQAQLEQLGLDPEHSPSDEDWSRLLAALNKVFKSGLVDRRQSRVAAESVIAELAEAAGLARTEHLIDAASGLPNCEALVIALGNALRVGNDTTEVAVLIVELEGLARVSDRLGENGRREVLCGAAERIEQVVRSVDLVTRGEGDEFGVLLGGSGSAERVRAISHRLERAFSEPLVAVGHYLYFTANVGAAVARPGSSATDALRRGRMALEWQRSTRAHPTASAQMRRRPAIA